MTQGEDQDRGDGQQSGGAPTTQGARGRRASLLGVVYRKELLDSLRDRRALISMIVVPLVVIPALIIGLGGLSYTLAERAGAEVHRVMVLNAGEAPEISAQLAGLETVRLIRPAPEFRQMIADKEVHAAVEFQEGFQARLEQGESAEVTIFTYEGDMRAGLAAQRLEAFFRGARDQVVRERLEAAGLPGEAIHPFAVARQNVAPPERVTGALLGQLLPYMLIVLCITGAIYPAMDLTAGEKERGTMETLLSSPVSRVTLVLGKFLVILSFSVITAVLAVGALGGTLWFALSRVGGGEAHLVNLAVSPWAVAGVLLLLLPVAAFFSAILLALSLFARTFKEAQTYVSPLILVALLPSVVALMPGVELAPGLSLVPVLNVSLLSREVLSGIYPWGYIAGVTLSSTLYAAAALALAVKLFQKESVIFRN
jgi:sodium transport system permease protein